ncbi:MAG TPA: DUF418 domain-containing protein [Caulobacteraceae bacterium]|jgi:uncharacterized protein
MTDTPAPVAERDRIASLDVLRGLGVMGILMVNAALFALPWTVAIDPRLSGLPWTPEALSAWRVTHVFFELKWVTLFSMLFGVSLYLVGGDGTDPARNRVVASRLKWLLLFGLIHGVLIWAGDILFHYAVVGFAMLLCRGMRPKPLLIWGSALVALMGFVTISSTMSMGTMPPEMQGNAWITDNDLVAKTVRAFQGGVVSATLVNAITWLVFGLMGLLGLGLRTFGLMMIGLGLFKLGVLQGRRSTLFYAGWVAAAAVSLLLIWLQSGETIRRDFDMIYSAGIGMAANWFLSPVVSLGYASLAILLLKTPIRPLLSLTIGSLGRMAFTNYIAQSLIMTTIFWGGRGLGLFGTMNRDEWIPIVLAIWAAQLIWSPLWLAAFRYGPLEWLWRRLSYGRPLPIRRRREPALAPA